MVVLGLANVIPTNTPAFQEYALHTMITNAESVASQWNLDVKRPFTTNLVTYNGLKPHPLGISGAIVLVNRFAFRALYGRFDGFADKPYECQVFLTDDVAKNDAVQEPWIRMTNLLTLQKAQKIAEDGLLSIGLTSDKTGFTNVDVAKQWQYDWDGKVYLLPYYTFKWKSAQADAQIDISGITSNIVGFDLVGPMLRLNRPTNYLELLGLPTNTVFVRRRFVPPGQPAAYELYEP
jgi:hypothetical protein